MAMSKVRKTATTSGAPETKATTLVSVHMSVEQKEYYRMQAEKLGQSLSGFFIFAADTSLQKQDAQSRIAALEAERDLLLKQVEQLQKQNSETQSTSVEHMAQFKALEQEVFNLKSRVESQAPDEDREWRTKTDWELQAMREVLKETLEYLSERDQVVTSLVEALNQKLILQEYAKRQSQVPTERSRSTPKGPVPLPYGPLDYQNVLRNIAYKRQFDQPGRDEANADLEDLARHLNDLSTAGPKFFEDYVG